MDKKYKLTIAASSAILLGSAASYNACACFWPFEQEITPAIIRKCPPIVNYSPEQQQKIARELQDIKENTEISKIITDYSKLRDACRVK